MNTAARTSSPAAVRRTARPARRARAAVSLRRQVALLALPALAAWGLLSGLEAWLDTDAPWLREASAAWCVGWVLATAWVAWAGERVWRAAVPPRAREPGQEAVVRAATLRRLAVRVGVVLLALLWAARLALDVAPQAAARLALAEGQDTTGSVQLHPSADGRRLRLQGPIGLGDAARVQAQLAAQPQVQLLELQADGTRLDEAARIADAVRRAGLQTRVVGACSNACLLPFLAGSARQVAPGARLGLNRPATPRLDPLGDALLRLRWATAWHSAGLPADFIQRGLHTPPGTPWSPDAAHLQATGLLDLPGGPMDVALPAGPGLVRGDIVDALVTHPLWQAMQLRFPGSVEMAAERVLAVQDAGALALPPEALQLAAQDVVQAALPAVLAAADALLHEQFLALVTESLASASPLGDAACTGVLLPDAAAKRALPLPLRQREATWLQDALASLPPEAPAQRRGDLEREVMRRALGDRAPVLLGTLWGPQRSFGPDPGCQRAAELLAAVARLPAGERRLAARLMFQGR